MPLPHSSTRTWIPRLLQGASNTQVLEPMPDPTAPPARTLNDIKRDWDKLQREMVVLDAELHRVELERGERLEKMAALQAEMSEILKQAGMKV